MKKCLTILAIWLLAGCSSGNLDWVKNKAEAKWAKQGFEVIDYEGFEWGVGGFGTSYGGARVWYRLKRIPDTGILYSGYLKRWGNEIHVYGPEPTDGTNINLNN